MKKGVGKKSHKWRCFLIAGAVILALAGCGQKEDESINLADSTNEEKRVVNLFCPIGKSDPNADNVSKTAQEKTVLMAEKKLGLTVNYRTYTADDYQDKTYDDVVMDRVRNKMDDFYLLNPDVIQVLGTEGLLVDLSGLDAAENLREVVKTGATVDGKLVAIPQEVVAHGLFLNEDLFKEYGLSLPESPEEFLECCRVFQKNGIETPIGANRWWLENFVFAQAYADLYNGGHTTEEIAALNSGERKYSDYMRPGFEFLQELIDKGYLDAQKAYESEAIEGEREDFLAQKTPVVMAYWGAANADTAYGSPDFNMKVTGFPSDRGPMPVVTITGYGIVAGAEHLEDAMKTLDVILSDEALQLYADNNQVISPSKNVTVDCIDALKPLNDRVNEGVYVLGSNPNMNVEQWGNVCLLVRELLNGASVDECMQKLDQLQEEALRP